MDHERVSLENEEHEASHPLAVIDWILQLLKRINRHPPNFHGPADYSRNIEIVMSFKKSCGNALKFSSNNIPFAMIQVQTIRL